MAEEEYLIQELRKIETRKKEREKRTQDLQKLITAADTTTEQRRAERKAPKKKLPQKKETEKPVNVSLSFFFPPLPLLMLCLGNVFPSAILLRSGPQLFWGGVAAGCFLTDVFLIMSFGRHIGVRQPLSESSGVLSISPPFEKCWFKSCFPFPP